MKSVDTRHTERYSPLIPAMKAIGEAAPGEQIQLIMDNAATFADLKEYLSEQQIGFREVYDGDVMVLEFEKPRRS